MKKVLASLVASILLIFVFVISACEDDKNGTYYPTLEEMRINLENNGFLTNIAVGERNSEGSGYVVDSVSASKGEDYIIFYWIENSAHCEVYYNKLIELHPDCSNFVLIVNDEKFGNIVYSGTANAISAAGIKVVNIDVKV